MKKNQNPWQSEIELMKRQISEIKYCKLCGAPILQSRSTADNRINYNIEWELQNGVHYECYVKFARENDLWQS